jgi:site-specific recombinase XerD
VAALAQADMKGLRDRAILLLGFAGAFRRSELVALVGSDRVAPAREIEIVLEVVRTRSR